MSNTFTIKTVTPELIGDFRHFINCYNNEERYETMIDVGLATGVSDPSSKVRKIRRTLENHPELHEEPHYLPKLIIRTGRPMHQKIEDMGRATSVEQYASFIEKYWNNLETYPLTSDIAQALDRGRDTVRKMARDAKNFRLQNPELMEVIQLPIDRNRKEVSKKDIVDEENKRDIFDYGSNSSRYVITSAQYGASVNKLFLSSLKNYCDKNDAKLIVMPIRYGMRMVDIDKSLREHVAFKTIDFNDNVMTTDLPQLPTTVDGLAQLERISGNKSLIIAHPKQHLRMVATTLDKTPKALMSTGAVTNPLYQYKRVGKIAENDHCFGAIVLEVVDDKLFHFRQLQADDNDGFYDLCGGATKYYSPVGIETDADATLGLICGDWHNGYTCPKVRTATYERGGLVDILNPKEIVKHDLFDGYSISHHADANTLLKARQSEDPKYLLKNELDSYVDELKYFLDNSDADLVVVRSNHDEHLMKYLTEARYVKNKDYNNYRIAHKLVDGIFDSRLQPEQWYATTELDTSYLDRITFLKRDDTHRIADIVVSLHGDQGSGGARGSIKGFNNAGQKTITGHTHHGAIWGNAWQVGCSTVLMDYAKNGLNPWTRTHCIIYKNGQRQLISFQYKDDNAMFIL